MSDRRRRAPDRLRLVAVGGRRPGRRDRRGRHGIETIGLLSQVLPVNALAPTVAALIGFGVAVDYALFVVTRHRTGLRAGLTVQEAAVTAVSTAGRAVVFAGATVAIAMLGLILLHVDFLTGVGIAAAIVVLSPSPRPSRCCRPCSESSGANSQPLGPPPSARGSE